MEERHIERLDRKGDRREFWNLLPRGTSALKLLRSLGPGADATEEERRDFLGGCTEHNHVPAPGGYGCLCGHFSSSGLDATEEEKRPRPAPRMA